MPDIKRQIRKTNRSAPNSYLRGSKTGSRSPFAVRPQKGSFRRKIVKLVDFLVILALIFCLVYSLIVRTPSAVASNSTAYHPLSFYAKAVDADISSFGNRNKITFNSAAVETKLRSQFPEISDVLLELPLFGQRPIVHLKIAPPTFFMSSVGDAFIVDSEGRVVARAKNMPQIKNLITIDDQSGFSASIGKQVLSADAANFITIIAAQCQHAGLSIASLTLPPVAQELDVNIKGQPYMVKFYLGGDPKLQVGQFLASRHQFRINKSAPTHYLDVRVPGKVFYK